MAIPFKVFSPLAMYCSESCANESIIKNHAHGLDDISVNEIARSKHDGISVICSSFTVFRMVFESKQTAGSIDRMLSLIKEPKSVSVFDFDFGNSSDTNLAWNRLRIINSLIPSSPSKIPVLRFLSPNLVSGPFIKRFMLINHLNGWGLSDKDEIIGTKNQGDPSSSTLTVGMFGPLLSHSCVPNTLLTSFGTKQVYFVVKPIRKNEQVFISYR
jgi:hypothetical protein